MGFYDGYGGAQAEDELDDTIDQLDQYRRRALKAEAEIERLRKQVWKYDGAWKKATRERDEAMAEIERLRDALQANRTAKAVAVAAANAERDEALALLDQLGSPYTKGSIT